jgi:hypothetical protein
MGKPTKIILHCHDAGNLSLMARAAEYCIKADMAEGDMKCLTYGEGQLPQPVHIGAIKRKSCITIYDQPNTKVTR